MLTKDLSITFCGVKFPNPFCLSSSPVGNCYEMCAKAYDTGWGGVVFKTIGFFIANEVSPRFDHLVKEDTGFIQLECLTKEDDGDDDGENNQHQIGDFYVVHQPCTDEDHHHAAK